MPSPRLHGFAIKPRKPVPYAFVLDALASASPRTNPLFGCLGIYVGNKIVLVLREKAGQVSNGVWLATTREHHESLRGDFPNMRSIEVLGGGGETGWQLLPAEAPDFEEAALHACDLILARDPRIGKVPKPKSKSRRAPKPAKSSKPASSQ
jgi:hypothetical protein